MPLDTRVSPIALPGPSRKRTHAEYSQSKSRSSTPIPPSKRRRISRDPMSHTPHLTSQHHRTARDGFDYRRPVMADAGTNTRNTIDLTLSDDEDEGDFFPDDLGPDFASDPSDGTLEHDQFFNEAPPRQQSDRPAEQENVEVIDLSDSEGDTRIPHVPIQRNDHHQERDSSSSDVEFVRERPVPNRETPHRAQSIHPRIHQQRAAAAPQTAFAAIPEIIRRGTQYVLGNMNVNDRHRAFGNFLAQPRNILNMPLAAGQRQAPGLDIRDDFEEVNFDYMQQGFAMGDRSSETPQVVRDPYKAPPPPKDGFTRTFGEDEILVCPMCNEELSTGKTSEDQKVWVIKQCGHVYCGRCASKRPIAASNKKDKSKSKSKEAQATRFTKCVVDGCAKPVTSKAALIPLYLGGE